MTVCSRCVELGVAIDRLRRVVGDCPPRSRETKAECCVLCQQAEWMHYRVGTLDTVADFRIELDEFDDLTEKATLLEFACDVGDRAAAIKLHKQILSKCVSYFDDELDELTDEEIDQ